MSKELHCGDIMDGCKHVVRGESEEEVMRKGAQHAKEAHGMAEMDEATQAKVKSKIRDA